MNKPKFYAKRSKHGYFEWEDDAAVGAYLQKFEEGTRLEITMGKFSKRRTQGSPGEATNFNGYYWGVVVSMVSDAMGEIDDDVTHNLLQLLFNKRGIVVIDPETKRGINVEVPVGTKHLTGAEFAEYCSKIRTWASIPGNLCEKGCYIPEPHEVDWERG